MGVDVTECAAVSERTLEVENLILAALLIVGGARLARMEMGTRFAKIVLDVEPLDARRLAGDAHQLGDLLAEIRADATAQDWTWLFASGLLGRVEGEYRRLKALVSDARRTR